MGRLPHGVTAGADFGAPDSGRLMYEGLRQVQQGSGRVTDPTGSGAAAYAYTYAATGLTVVTYEANAYLAVTAVPPRLGADLPEDLNTGLSATASSALDAHRT
ncbi:hypothetical protein [Micromonospora sp. LOL_024]|uniref:hypothetical protein n=1 Tax=Micromonospora sp. LOL_024 TaxID=3345412 RepID=UPI003A8AED2C